MENKHYCPRISVVIPARNEATNLRYVLPYIPTTVYEVILVDGHSDDNTIEVARQLWPSIHVIAQEGRGKGNALCTGFAACTGDIIVTLDADGSANPNEIPRFVEALLKGYDFAKGSRFIQCGGSEDITLVRNIGNYCLCHIANMLFHTPFSDLCYGYNAFWKRCLDTICVDCDGFEIETQINLRMHRANLKIIEVPSFERRRLYGQSNLRTFRDGWRVLQTIIRERRWHVPDSKAGVGRAKAGPYNVSDVGVGRAKAGPYNVSDVGVGRAKAGPYSISEQPTAPLRVLPH